MKALMEEIEKHDRVFAAVHEVGHAVVASQWDRGPVVVSLFPNGTEATVQGEHTVRGQTSYRTNLSGFRRSAIGWAGLMAEWLHEDLDCDPNDAWDAYEADPECVSPTDRLAIGAAAPRDVLRAARMAHLVLRANWPVVKKLTSYLIARYKKRRFAEVFWKRERGWLTLEERPLKVPPLYVAKRTRT